ncbi:hypothetical protein Q1695_008427 [Nippostrongylus brasiliensis]|nr:hypothetical protein Q1695_008427 [Nippostrongylus brasiliensis]
MAEDHFQAITVRTRCRSSAFLKTAVITTEEERRTRSSRHTIERYGHPIVEVAPDSDEGPSFVDEPRHRKGRRDRKPSIMKPCLGMSDDLRKEFSWIPPEIISAYAEKNITSLFDWR